MGMFISLKQRQKFPEHAYKKTLFSRFHFIVHSQTSWIVFFARNTIQLSGLDDVSQKEKSFQRWSN